ncbi:MAG: hypothetical protein JYX80_03585 [Candidatus Scalindua sediminis]|nr:hypothetical protein [Candidatus Scalindua sediminis]
MPTLSFESDKKPNKIIYLLELIGGFFYYLFQRFKEIVRIRWYGIGKKAQEYRIGWEIVKISKGITFGIFISISLLTLLDYGVSLIHHNFISSINRFLSLKWVDTNFIELILEISVGAISAILGIIFALYAVGFALTTEKYSSSVSDYVNQERVGHFFFKLLVFTDLFALFILLRLKFVGLTPFISFPAVIILVSISILGILTFKNHYIVAIKPKSLFRSLWGDLRENLKITSDRSKIFFKSWSIIQHVQRNSRESLDLIGTLFEDLWQAHNWNDAVYAPTVLASVLTEYANKKRYIDRDKGWWFPQKYDQIKSDNLVALPIKLNYELQGKGPLHVTKPDYNWLEDKVFLIMQRMESKLDSTDSKGELMSHIIYAYQTILTGDYEKDKYGRHQKDIYGLYGNQEIYAFDKFFTGFLSLFKEVNMQNDDHITAYMNAYFAVGLVLVEGFDYGNYQNEIQKLISSDQKLAIEKKHIEKVDLPTIFYDQLLDYWNRLNLEQECEGIIITPLNLLEKEMLEDAKNREKELFEKYFDTLIEHQNSIIDVLYNEKQYKTLTHFFKIRLEWLSRLLYIHKANIAEKYAQKIIGDNAVYLLDIPKDILIELELLEEIEKLIFPSVLEFKRSLFKELSGLLIMVLKVLNDNETDPDKIINRHRLIVILGGFIYFTSEFKQNKQLLIDYIKVLESEFKSGILVLLLEIMADPDKLGGLNLTLKLINWEMTKYDHWFMQILQKIHNLPKTYDNVRFYSGLQEVANHPSSFIREMSRDTASHEEECINAFVEWVKYREEIKKLITVISLIKNNANNK